MIEFLTKLKLYIVHILALIGAGLKKAGFFAGRFLKFVFTKIKGFFIEEETQPIKRDKSSAQDELRAYRRVEPGRGAVRRRSRLTKREQITQGVQGFAASAAGFVSRNRIPVMIISSVAVIAIIMVIAFGKGPSQDMQIVVAGDSFPQGASTEAYGDDAINNPQQDATEGAGDEQGGAIENIAEGEEDLTQTPEPQPVKLEPGVEHTEVAKLQERLMQLEYMDSDEPTEYYGDITTGAVKMFQKKNGLTDDGIAGTETLHLMNSDTAKRFTISNGDEGQAVWELQERLVELGYMDETTGFFGDKTEEAVKAFQSRNELSSDGTVGTQTRNILDSDSAKAHTVYVGTSGDEVKTLQERLVKLGYLTSADGVFGEGTLLAVKRFQERNALIADGSIGPMTKNLIYSSGAKANALILGMSGSDVQKAQERLRALGYMSAGATGYFGEVTDTAVRSFQKANGLGVDGTIGRQTLSVLHSSSAKKAASSSSGGGSSSSGGNKNSGNTGGSTPAPPVTNGVGVEAFISALNSKLGNKYVRGGKGPNTFDCSGFVYWGLNQAGVSQSYMNSIAWGNSTKYPRVTSMSEVQRGDVLLFSGTGGGRGHMGVALGNGTMIDASSSKSNVVIRSHVSSYWQNHFICAFRVF